MSEQELENETPENEIDGEEVTEEEVIKAEEVADNYQKRLTKAKAEAEKLKKEAEVVEKEAKTLKAKQDSESPKNEEQSDTPDYGKLAYLKSEGVDHPDDIQAVMEEANRLKLPIEKVLSEPYLKAKLKDARDQREAEQGMPEGGKGKTGGNKGSVDYWVNRKDKDGNFVTPSDTKLANEVIDARLKQETESSMFSDELY